MLDGKVEASRTTASITVFASALIGLYSFLFIQSSPITYYAYAIFPVMFWEEVFARRRALGAAKDKLFDKLSKQDLMKTAINLFAYIGILEIMVQSYYHREIYTIAYLLAVPWPALYGLEFVRKNWTLCLTWALSCTAMSVFTLLPANKVDDANLVLIGGFLILIIGALYIAFEKSLLVQSAPAKDGLASDKADGLSRLLMGIQVCSEMNTVRT
jgi:phosphatidylinositol glycan class N